MTDRSRGGPSGGGAPASRAGWEMKLQQLQDDLERREGFVAAQEGRLSQLQAEAEEVHARRVAVEVREAAVDRREAELDAAAESRAKHDALSRELQVELEAAREARRLAEEALETQEQEAAEQAMARAAMDTLMEVREHRLDEGVRSGDEQRAAVEARHTRMMEKQAAMVEEVNVLRHTLHRDRALLEQQAQSVSDREAAVAHQEKLANVLQEQDEKLRRSLRSTEQDLKRRIAAIAVTEQGLQDEQAALDARGVAQRQQQESMAAERAELLATESQLAMRAQTVAAAQRDATLEREITERRSFEIDEVNARATAVADQAEATAAHARELLRRADIDAKRAAAVHAEGMELAGAANVQRAELTKWHGELASWCDELEVRERFFTAAASGVTDRADTVNSPPRAASGIPDADTSVGPAYNKALSQVQMDRARQLYDVGVRRRVAGALHPMSRTRPSSAASALNTTTKSASKSRPATPLPQRRSPSAAPSHTNDGESRSNAALVVAQSNALALQEGIEDLAVTFKRQLAQLAARTGTKPQPGQPLPDSLFDGVAISARDEAVIRHCAAREHDIIAEMRMRYVVAACPYAAVHEASATAQSDVNPASTWWQQLAVHLATRREAVQLERTTTLQRAVAVLEALDCTAESPQRHRTTRPPIRPASAPVK